MYRNKLVIGFLILSLLIGLLLACSSAKEGYEKGTKEETEEVEPKKEEVIEEKKEEPKPEPTWHEVKIWTGNGRKNTEPFEIIGKQWKITRSNSHGYFGLWLCSANTNQEIELVECTTDPVDNNESYFYQPGNFYLKIDGSNWTVKIEDKY